eukprot:14786783-Ditylum_brightwellii.AAC.1
MVLSNTRSCDLLPRRLRLGNARSPSDSPLLQTQSHIPSGRTTRGGNHAGGDGHRGGRGGCGGRGGH